MTDNDKMEININLDTLVSDTFRKVFSEIVNCELDRAILNGGRSSTKSQVASEAIVVGCTVYKQSAVAAVKYANKIEERLVNTFRETIKYLHLEQYWKLRKSPYEYVLLDDFGKETDVSIKFTGCDNPLNLKSFKPRSGSFRYIWFEETTNFKNLNELNNLIESFARGKGKHCVICTYNPPIQTSNWVNLEYNAPIGKVLGYDTNSVYTEFKFKTGNEEQIIRQCVHHSTYLDIIKAGHADWLGTTFIGEAEKQKEQNNKYYRFAYLGEVIGTDANVFSNIHDWDGNKDEINITEVFRGFDWGYGGPDPCAYTEWAYDRRKKIIYCIGEFGKPKMSIDDIVSNIKSLNKYNFPVYGDSAVPLLNGQLRAKNINVIDVKKGKDSVRGGIRWLQSLLGIYISPVLTPNTYREFKNYEYKIDTDDNVTSELPDKDNHFIDSTRYALSNEIKYN